MVWNTPLRSTFSTAAQPSRVTSAAVPGAAMPALGTTMSSLPCSAATSLMTARVASASATSRMRVCRRGVLRGEERDRGCRDVHGDDGRTFGVEAFRDRRADPGDAAGDDGYLAGEAAARWCLHAGAHLA
jgi:hypothetical protein